MEKRLEKLFEQAKGGYFSRFSREELLQMLEEKIYHLDKHALEEMMQQLCRGEYGKARDEYCRSIAGEVEKLLALIEMFQAEEGKRPQLLKLIVGEIKKDRMLISHTLASKLVYPILYALEIKDLKSSALLMKSRMRIKQDSDKHGYTIGRSAEAIDRMDLMDKFVMLIAEKCDEKSAQKYIKELGQGVYASLLRIVDGRYCYVGEDFILEMYADCKSRLAEDEILL
ncbi:MAG: hypothetical protein IJY90_03225 [Clostridia bacterium]|nr:hypothetical protein [Clostridia bacterium]